MNENDLPALILQDIKNMLIGLAVMLLGGISIVAALLDFRRPLLLIGILLVLGGIIAAAVNWRAHRIPEIKK